MSAPISSSTKILCIDDHPLYSAALTTLLVTELGCQVETVGLLESARICLEASHYDLVVADLTLPDSSRASSIAFIRQLCVCQQVLVVSGTATVADADAVMRAGVAGYLPKTASPEDTLAAVRTVLSGGRLIPAEWTSGIQSQTLASAPATPLDGVHERIAKAQIALTARQWEVLKQLAEGASNKLIARSLGMAEKTVKVHTTAIFRELGVANRTQAANIANSLAA